jgi:biopolymer transport protein ExbB
MSSQKINDATTIPVSAQTIVDSASNTITTESQTDLDVQITIDSSSTAGLFDLSQLESLVGAGGPVIAILMLISIAAVAVFLLKSWQFSWMGISRYKRIHVALSCWHSQKSDEALSALSKTRNPIARVLETAMRLKTNHSDDAIAREETTRIAKRELAKMRSHLKILEVIATLSPLLGLLGTVLGMIEAFQKLQGAGSTIDPSILSGGIWEALLTTAAGLVVAIPAVVALNWLEQRIERFKQVMEDTMTQVFTSVAQPTTTSHHAEQRSLAKQENQPKKHVVSLAS